MSSSYDDGFAIPGAIFQPFRENPSPYTEDFAGVVRARRNRQQDALLFFDRLLSFADLDGPVLYPPTTPADLRRIIHSILASSLDRVKQACFIYYLLKDYDRALQENQANGDMQLDSVGEVSGLPSGDQGGVGLAEAFAKQQCLPRTWRVFMNGYSALDNEEWADAVTYLSDPCISEINFVPQIINVLATAPSPPSHAVELLYSFLTNTALPLEAVTDIEIKVLALAGAGSLLEAFSFIRRQDDEALRPRLREGLWSWALGAPRSPCGSGKHGVQAKIIKQLLHIPLNPEEHSHLLRFLSHPPRNIPSQAVSALHDLVTLRLVHQGQYAESIALDKESAGAAGSEADRQRRREMVREFIALLPETQRRALAIEGEGRAAEKERERIDMANGSLMFDLTEDDANVDMEDKTIGTQLQPAPIANGSRPQSPAPQARNSPFAGPPRFASTQLNTPGMRQRVLSGSPFALPRAVSATGSPAPRQPLKLINDDDAPIQPLFVRTLRDRPIAPSTVPPENEATDISDIGMDEDENKENEPIVSSFKPTSAARRGSPARAKQPSPSPSLQSQTEPDSPILPPPTPRRSHRVVSGASQPPKDMSPVPQSPPTRQTRTSRRSGRTSMPGQYQDDSTVTDGPSVPPTPSTATRPSGPESRGPPRSRMTRSVSRALDDVEIRAVEPKAKRTRRAREGSAQVEEATPARGVRRSARAMSRASTVQPSEQGSPTPSVDIARPRRRGVRESSVSQTPRATRSRK